MTSGSLLSSGLMSTSFVKDEFNMAKQASTISLLSDGERPSSAGVRLGGRRRKMKIVTTNKTITLLTTRSILRF